MKAKKNRSAMQVDATPNTWSAIAIIAALLLSTSSHAAEYRCEAMFRQASERAEWKKTHPHVRNWTIVTVESQQEALALGREKLDVGWVGCRMDTPPMVPGAMAKRQQEQAMQDETEPKETPFSSLTMGDYFDAGKYIGKAIAQYKDFLDKTPLAKKLLGDLDMNKASLVVPAIRTYAQSYGKVYEQCLGKNAVSYTMRTTTRDRTGTHVSDTVYRMNPEFAKAFEATTEEGSRDALGEGLAALGDASVGNPLARIEAGTQQLMRTFRCDDPVMKRFESNLLEIYLTIAKDGR
jgi:hypothetical protein